MFGALPHVPIRTKDIEAFERHMKAVTNRAKAGTGMDMAALDARTARLHRELDATAEALSGLLCRIERHLEDVTKLQTDLARLATNQPPTCQDEDT